MSKFRLQKANEYEKRDETYYTEQIEKAKEKIETAKFQYYLKLKGALSIIDNAIEHYRFDYEAPVATLNILNKAYSEVRKELNELTKYF